jgi:hypothetical protein
MIRSLDLNSTYLYAVVYAHHLYDVVYVCLLVAKSQQDLSFIPLLPVVVPPIIIFYCPF